MLEGLPLLYAHTQQGPKRAGVAESCNTLRRTLGSADSPFRRDMTTTDSAPGSKIATQMVANVR